ncbi:MAG: type II toxin-antitoxin system RelE/ParE family toxin [Rhodobacterales bacterium]|nr:type II toxin-antitoxin system RelE/ParE family toxin [Rhodobacterales bacterium]
MDRVASIGQKLSQWRDLGKARPELRHDLRSFPTDNYLVYYRERNEVIEIVRVLHGRRDVDAIF